MVTAADLGDLALGLRAASPPAGGLGNPRDPVFFVGEVVGVAGLGLQAKTEAVPDPLSF